MYLYDHKGRCFGKWKPNKQIARGFWIGYFIPNEIIKQRQIAVRNYQFIPFKPKKVKR